MICLGFKGYNFLKNIFLALKISLIFANSAYSDDMPHYATFHLGFHCLPKYPFRVSCPQRVKQQKNGKGTLSWYGKLTLESAHD